MIPIHTLGKNSIKKENKVLLAQKYFYLFQILHNALVLCSNNWNYHHYSLFFSFFFLIKPLLSFWSRNVRWNKQFHFSVKLMVDGALSWRPHKNQCSPNERHTNGWLFVSISILTFKRRLGSSWINRCGRRKKKRAESMGLVSRRQTARRSIHQSEEVWNS